MLHVFIVNCINYDAQPYAFKAMRPKKAHTQTKNRLLRFEDDLDHLLSTSNFHTMEELFRSRAFKRITLRLGRRPRENDKKSPLRLDAFYKQAKDRCTGNVNSRAFRSCGKGKQDNIKINFFNI